MAVPDSRVQRAYRVRMSFFLLAVIIATVALAVAYQGIYTLRVLNAVKYARDRWQKPAAVMEALKLKNGSIVADIGSGARYFTLKMAPIVVEHGRVFAADILKEPLAFLWVRALLRHQSNVHIIHVDPDTKAFTLFRVLKRSGTRDADQVAPKGGSLPEVSELQGQRRRGAAIESRYVPAHIGRRW